MRYDAWMIAKISVAYALDRHLRTLFHMLCSRSKAYAKGLSRNIEINRGRGEGGNIEIRFRNLLRRISWIKTIAIALVLDIDPANDSWRFLSFISSRGESEREREREREREKEGKREKPFTRVLQSAVRQGLRSKSRSDVTRDIKRALGPQAGAGASRKDESWCTKFPSCTCVILMKHALRPPESRAARLRDIEMILHFCTCAVSFSLVT